MHTVEMGINMLKTWMNRGVPLSLVVACGCLAQDAGASSTVISAR